MNNIYLIIGKIFFWIVFIPAVIVAFLGLLILILDILQRQFKVFRFIHSYAVNKKDFLEWFKQNKEDNEK